jgi:uncharacterized protein with FMN-binding domain
MKIKRILYRAAVAVVIAAAVFAMSLNLLNMRLGQLSMLRIENVDLKSVDDGSYLGSYQVLPLMARVKVEIKDHRILNIEIVKHVTGQGKAAEAVVRSIIEKQRVDVDAVAGATYSSRIIEKAVERALTGGEAAKR